MRKKRGTGRAEIWTSGEVREATSTIWKLLESFVSASVSPNKQGKSPLHGHVKGHLSSQHLDASSFLQFKSFFLLFPQQTWADYESQFSCIMDYKQQSDYWKLTTNPHQHGWYPSMVDPEFSDLFTMKSLLDGTPKQSHSLRMGSIEGIRSTPWWRHVRTGLCVCATVFKNKKLMDWIIKGPRAWKSQYI